MTIPDNPHYAQVGDRPTTDLELADGAYLQYLETGDGCYIDNMHPDEMRAFIRNLADTDRARNDALPHDRRG